MWIPVIIIAWNLTGSPIWVNFPMVNFPFSALESCQDYVKTVREQVTKSDKYVSGYSVCVEVPDRQGLPT